MSICCLNQYIVYMYISYVGHARARLPTCVSICPAYSCSCFRSSVAQQPQRIRYDHQSTALMEDDGNANADNARQ